MVAKYIARAYNKYYEVEARQYTGYEQEMFGMPIVDGRLGNTIHVLKMRHWVVKDCNRSEDGTPHYIIYYPDQFEVAFKKVTQSPSASL
jgi:hypothetical protein